MRIFISGGCKNGKSYYAQRLAKAQSLNLPLYYIATMSPVDGEDEERIERHRRERKGWGFITIEQHTDIEKILEKCDRKGSFLLDSVTALLAGEMFPAKGGVNSNAAGKITAGIHSLTACIENLVIVSDYIYSDAALYDPLTEKYRESLAEIDRAAAKLCDAVLEVSNGNVIIHKGGEVLGAIYEKIF